MKIFVKAKPGAKHERVEKIDTTHFAVAVREPAKEGKANAAIIKALADYFDIPRSRVNLVSGSSRRQKTFEIL